MHLTAIWLLPQDRVYGDWPRSGEIDLLESRGNRKYVDHNNEHIGVENFGSTLHFGPRWDQDGWSTATMNKRTPAGQGYDRQFHNYKLEWTPTYIRVFLDNNRVGEISVDDGFWKRGNFQGENIWPNDSPMAPFDKEVFSYWFFFFCRSMHTQNEMNCCVQFFLIMNLAVGGTNGYFPDAGNDGGKPWANSQPFAHTAYWNGKQQWMNTWNLMSRDSALVIDSVKIWAL